MYSSNGSGSLYVVEVRTSDGYREQVADMEFSDFWAAKGAALQLDRWLKRGHCYGLPDAALDLRAELRGPCDVWVCELPKVGERSWDTRPAAQVLVIDCTADDEDDEGSDDTAIVVEAVGAV